MVYDWSSKGIWQELEFNFHFVFLKTDAFGIKSKNQRNIGKTDGITDFDFEEKGGTDVVPFFLRTNSETVKCLLL